MRTHYDNLQVSREASPEVIKAAYKALAQKLHPDRNPSVNAAQQFGFVSDAYDKLSDPVYKREYDRFLASKGVVSAPSDSETIALFMLDAWIKGRLAAESGEPISSNPFPNDAVLSDLWVSAYQNCPKILKIYHRAKHLAVVWTINIVAFGILVVLAVNLKGWLKALFQLF